MRGVQCSWVDALKIYRDLSGAGPGGPAHLKRLRCVDKGTISRWKATCDVIGAVEGQVAISQLEHCQPSHAVEIARAFRRRKQPLDDEAGRAAVAEWVERCEAERWTVQQLRRALAGPRAEEVDGPAPQGGTVEDLHALVAEGHRFGTVYADPPWPFDRSPRGAASRHYPTMPLAEIEALPVRELAAADAHCHLWVPHSFLPDAFRALAVWGFEYRSIFVWAKGKIGTGYYWRAATEFLLLGVRGECPFRDHSIRNWQELPRGAHSAKPEEVRRLIERVSPGPRLELFARQQAEGWTCWGGEIPPPTAPPAAPNLFSNAPAA